MKKIILAILFIVSVIFLNALVREVSLDGSHQFTSIQSAIDYAADGDTVLVYPGRYFENIAVIEKELKILSHYVISNTWDDVLNTVIDANSLSNCLRVESNAIVTFNGFMLENGIGHFYSISYGYGGGVSVYDDSTLNLSNCVIQNNEATVAGGVGVTDWCTLNLSGTIIRNNKSVYRGGGLGSYGGIINFSEENPCSIYNNYGDIQDIYMSGVLSSTIYLDTLSLNITEPDGYFVSYYSSSGHPSPAVSVQNAYYNQIDADLYVSSDGADSNDGLTPETALRTIAYANRLVQPDSIDTNTVHILPGTYSTELNNQFFPIAIQSNTNMIGTGNGPEEVVIGDEWGMNQIIPRYSENIEIANMLIHRANEDTDFSLGAGRCNNLYIHDIILQENNNEEPGVAISSCSDVLIENVTVQDIDNNRDGLRCIKINECNNVTLNNIIVDNIYNMNNDGFNIYFYMSKSQVMANNISITNCFENATGRMFQFGNSSTNGNPEGSIHLNNLLFYNNQALSNESTLLGFSSRFNDNYINNVSIVHNFIPSIITAFVGNFTVRNGIFYNPNVGCEIEIWEPANGDPTPLWSNVDLDYNLIRNGLAGIPGADNPNNNVLWGDHNINANPMFRGDVEGDIPLGDPRWVQLTENSPCVNAGTPDTLGMNLPALDITGNPRVWGDIIDMGAHEYNPTVENSDETAPTPPATIQVSHFPNPVTPNGNNGKVAFIEFTLPKKPIEKPTLEIYNIKGQKVRDLKITQSFSQLVRSAGLSSEDKQTGEHYSKIWDCKDNNRKTVASGIYFYKVSCEGEEAIGRMMVVK